MLRKKGEKTRNGLTVQALLPARMLPRQGTRSCTLGHSVHTRLSYWAGPLGGGSSAFSLVPSDSGSPSEPGPGQRPRNLKGAPGFATALWSPGHCPPEAPPAPSSRRAAWGQADPQAAESHPRWTTPTSGYSPRQRAQGSYDHRMKAKEKNKNKNRN